MTDSHQEVPTQGASTKGTSAQEAPSSSMASVPRPLLLVTTWFGSGLSPVAPGTMGSAAALPFAWGLMWAFGPWGLGVATVLVTVLGIWACNAHVRRTGEQDPGRIVIDEVAGQWLTLLPAPLDPVSYLIGFALFRLFDITKPWPVGALDRGLKGGLGIMLDDIAAGVYAGVLVALVVAVRAAW
ncbi:phosphatidylglycerophosphatase A family protein [Pararhodospirillum oryzae]|uniref:Phosphatidylglycerophosphatase A n=1 Tax=Pararhodospirillum oryzae TaxID=478448 RepID=A0A512HB86_9PROT|nr:phosphatidylglycerophosphatase A [Pararhodospirillum oryzae]GEO82716.1 hypothetical protein ROR02_28470 [Pararhodospirillum oryzae]